MRAEYRQADETILLTGQPRLTDTSPDKAVLDIAADRITLHRSSGDGFAEGAVKTSYISQPGAATAHVVGDRALLLHAQQTITFTGSPRLWQDGNAVEAPTLVLTEQPRGLLAESPADGPPAVHAVFVQHDPKHPQPPVRVTSRTLVYSDAERKARFTTGVTLIDNNGTVRADKMDVFLKAATPAGSAPIPVAASHAPGAPMGGQLDHILATGDVFVEQPLRQGTGAELVYTADDGKFVLTGSAGRPPRIEDQQKGTVTGDALVFLSRDDKVDVENGGGRTVTTTHLFNKGDSK
jgi:lipopolysaccharide export system protein LptA